MKLQLPSKLLLGSATAATQIEGGDRNSNWFHWSEKGMIARGESSIVAADHYNRYEEDIAIMQSLNQEIYRMSIEWSRIEPRRGQWSQEGIDHYRHELALLKEAGIAPLVTLHHFSHPQWFEDMGAWTAKESVDLFVRFTKKVVAEMGDLIDEYCTINEPNVFLNDTYMDGKYPPGKKDDIASYFKAAKNLILAHLEAYETIHCMRNSKGYTSTRVGIAHHLAYFESRTTKPLNRLSKKLMDYSFHKLFFLGMVEGKLSFPIGSGYPLSEGRYCDFIGVNYYSRHLIHSSKNPAMLFGQVKVEAGLPDHKVNDLGWEIYPEGLFKVIKEVYDTYQIPIYITENGIPDAKDQKRAKFIYDHLVQVCKLVESGVDVQRYYHWSLLDNMEWDDGYGPRFGLVEVNYETLERTIRPSGHFYGDICKTKAVSQEAFDRYVKTTGNESDKGQGREEV